LYLFDFQRFYPRKSVAHRLLSLTHYNLFQGYAMATHNVFKLIKNNKIEFVDLTSAALLPMKEDADGTGSSPEATE